MRSEFWDGTPSPLPKNRRLTHDAFVAAANEGRGRHSDEEWQVRYDRLTWFANAVLEASLAALPEALRGRWKGSVAVDATVVPAYARAERRAEGKGKAATRSVLTHSADPDAAWYHRDDSREAESRSVWGYEATLIVSGPESPHEAEPFPSLVVAMAPLHKPGHDPGKNAIVALSSLRARGHPANWLAGDRAYSNQKPEHFQL